MTKSQAATVKRPRRIFTVNYAGHFFTRLLRSRRFWLILLVSIGLAWRLGRYFLNFPIWGDEAAVGLNILDRSYLGLLRPLSYDQACPVGFLWLSKWMIVHFGTSSFVVRFVPLVAALASVLLMYPIARKFAGPWIALLATGLLACSLSPARFSNDFKPYSIDLLVALIYTGLGLWALRRPRDWIPPLLLILFTPLALVFSYPSVFVAGAVSLALAARWWNIRSTARTTLWMLYNVILLGCFGVLFFKVAGGQLHATRQQGIVRAWGTAFPPLDWHLGWWLIRSQFGNMMSYPMGGEWGVSLLISPLCWLGAWRLWRRGRGAELVLLVAPFLATLAASFLRAYPYGRDARVEQHLVPAIMLLASLGLFSGVVFLLRAVANHRRAIQTAVAGACTAMAIFAIIAAMINVYHPWISRGWEQTRQIVQEVFSGTDQKTQIVFMAKSGAMPVNVLWYLRRQRHSWLAALPAAKRSLAEPGASLWVIDFSHRTRKHFSGNIQRQLAARKVAMNLVAYHRQSIYLGGVSPLIYAQVLHFENQTEAR